MNNAQTYWKTRRSLSAGALAPWLAILLLGQVWLAPAGTWAGPINVTVSILPQAWFVEEIGGDLVEVSVLVGPGHSPATYEPTPRQMAILEQADLFLAAGVPFEQGLVPRVQALPRAPVIAGPRPALHSHQHSSHDIDPHTWLDPDLARGIADSVSARLQALDVANAGTFQERCHILKERLARIDEQVRHNLAPYRGRTFIVFHPAFGHFAAAYGLNQVSIETGGHDPGPRHLVDTIEHALALGANSVIVQPQFSRKSAETLAKSLGAEIVVLDPLAADYEKNLLHIARTLADRFAAEDHTASLKDGS